MSATSTLRDEKVDEARLEEAEATVTKSPGCEDSNVVTWDSADDPEDPHNWPFRVRWTLMVLNTLITFMAGLSSSMFAPSVPTLSLEFNNTNSVLSSFVVTIFVLGLATGPLCFAPLSEIYGRLPVQHAGNAGFLAFTIACALAPSFESLIVFRLLQGVFAAVSFTLGGAIIADMVRTEERGFAVAMFTLGALLGPVVGPVAGSFLTGAKGWRWNFWVVTIMLGVLTILCLAFWRESYAPVLLELKAERLRRETGNSELRSEFDTGLSPRAYIKRSIVRPLKLLLFSPIVLALAIWQGLVYAYFYLLFTTLTPIFTSVYGWQDNIAGLSYLGAGVGFMLGQGLFAFGSDRLLKRLSAKGDGKMMPEYRLPPGILGGVSVAVGLIWYGWGVEKSLFWFMPLVGTAFLGLGNSTIFMTIQTYTIDAFTTHAASALAANMVLRSIMAGTIPLAAPKMYESLGYGWGNSLLGFLALACVPIPWALMVYGKHMRQWNGKRLDNL